jgi:hypothetical protein
VTRVSRPPNRTRALTRSRPVGGSCRRGS